MWFPGGKTCTEGKMYHKDGKGLSWPSKQFRWILHAVVLTLDNPLDYSSLKNYPCVFPLLLLEETGQKEGRNECTTEKRFR